MNKLLAYLETGGEGAVVRPWVWISWLFLGPVVGSVTFQWYIFVGSRMTRRAQAILTSLIFDHSLRIRVKAEDDKSASTSAGPSAAVTPDNASVAESAEGGSADSENGSEGTTVGASTVSVGSSAKDKQKAKDKAVNEQKPTSPPPGEKSKNLVGKLNNLVTVDIDKITNAREFVMILVMVPLQTGLSAWFLYTILGWSSFVGLTVMLALFPIPGYIASLTQKVQREKMKKTDARVQAVTDTMSVIRMIKLFGWEPRMSDQIAQKRKEELALQKKYQILSLTVVVSNYVIPLVTLLATLFTYTVIMKQELSASKLFSSIAVFDILRGSLAITTGFLPSCIQGKVSLERVQDFLRNTELLDQFASAKEGDAAMARLEASSGVVGIREAAFTWANESDESLTPGSQRRRFILRIEDELIFKRGQVNLIVGPTGSGKTSLLMALLGEMHYIPSGPNSFVSLPRGEGVAFAAQESWDNILFGCPYDEERYNKVIVQCALERDLSLFDAGDQTEVGEKGLTLSGGQKARVTFARAIYSSAEILLLDDILAALDVHTAKWIVDKCLKGDLVRGRTVILVTHNVAVASPIADFVVSLSMDGRIASQGSLDSALANNATLSREVQEEEEEVKEAEQEVDEADLNAPAPKSTSGKLVVQEEIAVGHIGRTAFKMWTKALGGSYPLLFWVWCVGGIFSTDVVIAIQVWFLGYWAAQYEDHDPREVHVGFYLGLYSVMLFLLTFFYATSWIAWVFGGIRASTQIHRDLITSILGTTLRRLDQTPVSRIIARCTQDVDAIDSQLTRYAFWMIDGTLDICIRFFVVVAFSPVFSIPGAIIAGLGGWCGQIYLKAQLCVKREMSNAKAPVIGHFGAAVAGLTSIRAYGAQEAFKQESMKRINRLTRATVPFYDLNRWVTVRLDALGGIFSSSLAAYLVYVAHVQASNIGFSLNMAVGFANMILWWVRNVNELEVNANSLERIEQYLEIEHEPKPSPDGIPPAYWPASGDLKVEKLSARYSPDGPRVLHEVSFEVKSGERIGIVGRTGSGKSSLTLALLRAIITEGKVYYDGLPTDAINLDALRTNITIIPQVPELLSGTLRQNLDPFNQYDDTILNDALRAAGLFSLQNQDDEGRITLDSEIASGGNNLSVGQRQILALARTIVRQSKILILDEATSAIDYATDIVIQQSLRNELGKDVTLLIVAHRLQTIMDADKIMVLDAGRIVEFDKPSELLKNPQGLLRALVEESGEKDALYEMAQGTPL
ncbi:P-loop containing nucleoside triphosphate hydrolase protein [Obba rivulosa]|uniref:P-loop containing nucleoside triphosphate hydrolase protein n=1 Tax=Obba rivulosa TaxID=1052685 RepID=A0A8E2DIJ8_9APHY|nr:P-loop containing nucleoside triphosphate hydrolase protein [Obba rivulosa]